MKKQTVSSTLEGNGNIIDHPVIVVSTKFVKGDVWVVATQFAFDFQPYHWKKNDGKKTTKQPYKTISELHNLEE